MNPPPAKPERTIWVIRDTRTGKTVGANHYLTEDAAKTARRRKYLSSRFKVEEITVR
ncbi:hypothetical protein [Kribbella solani]|uniref:Uncharacterized protein n=1 Tax=Kribbella solani TaxID=236067 RepID=A0A841E6N7_9ACTN|nr:hypothetical protein [Kribbella solani]MBB5983987.1 hypothetical protein [Kribbella solani]